MITTDFKGLLLAQYAQPIYSEENKQGAIARPRKGSRTVLSVLSQKDGHSAPEFEWPQRAWGLLRCVWKLTLDPEGHGPAGCPRREHRPPSWSSCLRVLLAAPLLSAALLVMLLVTEVTQAAAPGRGPALCSSSPNRWGSSSPTKSKPEPS